MTQAEREIQRIKDDGAEFRQWVEHELQAIRSKDDRQSKLPESQPQDSSQVSSPTLGISTRRMAIAALGLSLLALAIALAGLLGR